MAGLKELQQMNNILRKKIRIKKQGGKSTIDLSQELRDGSGFSVHMILFTKA